MHKKAIPVIALVLSACSADDPTPAQQATGPTYRIEHITGDLYQAGVSGAGQHTTVFVVTPEGVILGDTINSGFAEWLKAELRDRFDTHVEYVLYSHHHPDHASGGSIFADTATFFAHAEFATALDALPSNSASMDTSGNGSIERSEATGGMLNNFDSIDTNQDGALSPAEVNADTYPPDITYRDKLTVSLGDTTVEMHHTTPAHSDDMSILFFPEERVVFVVDFLQINRFPGGLTGFLSGYTIDDHENAVADVQALDFETVIQGHSDLIGTRADVQAFMTLLRTTEAEVSAAITAGLSMEETLDTVMLPEYSDWLLYENRRPALVGNLYEFLSQQ